MNDQLFDVSNIKIGSEKLRYNDDKSVVRIIPLMDIKNKNLYFKTDAYGKNILHVQTRYITKDNKVNVLMNVDANKYREMIETYTNDKNELTPPEKGLNVLTIEKLNKFKKDLCEKLKYIMSMPVYTNEQNQSSYNIKCYINSNGKIPKILDYNNKICDLDHKYIKKIFEKCNCSLLVQLKSLIVTSKSVHLEIALVRIYPNNLELITDQNILMGIYNDINMKSIDNMNKIKEYDSIYISRKYHKKDDIKDQLKSILKT